MYKFFIKIYYILMFYHNFKSGRLELLTSIFQFSFLQKLYQKERERYVKRGKYGAIFILLEK